MEEFEKDSVQERVVREGISVAEQLSYKEDNSSPESTGTAAVVTAPPA